MGRFNVRDFGAVGDGVHDDFPAFRDALNAIDAAAGGDSIRGAILFVPSGKYRVGQTIRITRSIVLEGAGQHSSILEFVAPGATPIAGIVVENGTSASGLPTLPNRAIIRGLGVQTPVAFHPLNHRPKVHVPDDDDLLNGTASGIVLYYRASVENCNVIGFEHDGIHINSSSGTDRNADNWQVRDCFVTSNGRHGLFVSGHDANTGCALNVQCQVNCGWGFYEKSALGNTYLACVADSNGHINGGPADPLPNFGGGYRSTQKSGFNLLLNCYSELDQANRFTRRPWCSAETSVDPWISIRPSSALWSSGMPGRRWRSIPCV